MTLADSFNICPYTGLRSFTEEESLYFKGRDEQIDQICQLLEKNKFLMITGASGEGKSSLVYAGLIPNARAGFFKAKYNNWIVVDFRPERSPLSNLSKSLSDKLGLQEQIVSTELKRGYSSLIDLYKSSDYYIDEKNEGWQTLDENEKLNRKRSAANLLILVDQFEEFFTNPENYLNGKTSVDAQIVVNLILETSKLSLQNDLPVYVATTMRSDYIGQCSSFRGLPEHIGFSQFFVPRLKRKELKQVIEEPAMLSGNRISNRLIERLVYDISEGIDQLPILQHALSQIWLAADHGNAEMDLIHYAMVGGMPVKELPEEDQKTFLAWHRTIPEYQHKFFHDTGLNRVIEIHASKLYESAWEVYNETNPNHPISQKEGKNIVAMTFACLTKIDNSRAVRNRMTVTEITHIINKPGITEEVVSQIVNLFRKEGNSFIRPFITEDTDTQSLSPDSVLDITHESLIRNWRSLNKWANKEFEFYSTFLDFQKQLNRWRDHGKSRSFLLPIGPLNYFEEWYEQCKPNIWWINRYGDKEKPAEESLEESKNILNDTHEFLKRSARKVMVSRAFMKYGAQKIATFSAILIMLALSGFYWYDAEEKKNTSVIEEVREKASVLLNSPEIDDFEKSLYLITEERLYNGTLISYIESNKDLKSRLGLSVNVYRVMKFIDKKFNKQIKFDLIEIILRDIEEYHDRGSDKVFYLEQLNKFIITLAYDDYYITDPRIKQAISSVTDYIPSFVTLFYNDASMVKSAVSIELNEAISLWLTFGNPEPQELQDLINAISPFAGENAKAAFDVYYKEGSYEPNGRLSNDHSGGYHMLATLYAALGDNDGIISCFENLDEQYFIGSLFNNYNNVIGYLYQFKHRANVPGLIKWIHAHYPSDTPTTIYRNMVIRAGYIPSLYSVNFFKDAVRSHKGYFHVNLGMGDRKIFREIVEDYEKEINKLSNRDERNFLMAFNLKRISVFEYKYHHDRGSQLDPFEVEKWLDTSMDYYRKVSQDYLNEEMSITYPYWGDGIRNKQFPRKQLYIYPDYMDGWFSLTYQTDGFFDYLMEKDLLKDLYTTQEDLEMMHLWISQAHEVWPFFPITFTNSYVLPDQVLLNILEFVDQHPEGQQFDQNLLHLILANRAFKIGDTTKGIRHFKLLNMDAIASSSTRYEYLNQTFFLNQMKELSFHLASIGKIEESVMVSEKFQKDSHKIISYIFNADKLYNMDYNPDSFIFLDSAFSKMETQNLSNLSYNEDYRFKLIHVLSKMGGERLNSMAKDVLRDITEGDKFDAILSYVWGATADQNYYNAVSSIPKTLTESQELQCYGMLLWETCKQSDNDEAHIGWEPLDFIMTYDMDYYFFVDS